VPFFKMHSCLGKRRARPKKERGHCWLQGTVGLINFERILRCGLNSGRFYKTNKISDNKLKLNLAFGKEDKKTAAIAWSLKTWKPCHLNHSGGKRTDVCGTVTWRTAAMGRGAALDHRRGLRDAGGSGGAGEGRRWGCAQTPTGVGNAIQCVDRFWIENQVRNIGE